MRQHAIEIQGWITLYFVLRQGVETYVIAVRALASRHQAFLWSTVVNKVRTSANSIKATSLFTTNPSGQGFPEDFRKWQNFSSAYKN